MIWKYIYQMKKIMMIDITYYNYLSWFMKGFRFGFDFFYSFSSFWERKKFEALFVQPMYITDYYKYTDSNRDLLFRIDM